MSRRELWLTAALLLVVAAVVYGPHVVEGGFTVDDYGHAVAAQHQRDGILEDYWAFTSNRPGLVGYIPLTHLVLGPNPAPHLALAIVLAVLMSLALHALLRRLAVPRVHAAAIAVLVLLFPWSDSARFWAVAGHISLAIAIAVAGVLLALRGLDARAEGKRRKGVWLHVGAVALYAVSVLTYEAAGGVLLLVGALYLTRASRNVASRRWIADVAVVLPCLAWNALRADRERSSLAEMVDHAREIADAGATVVALAAIPFGHAGRQAILAGGDAVTQLILGALLAVVAAGVVVHRLLPSGDAARPVLGRWIVTVGAGLLVTAASWVIYIPADPYYNPGGEGVGNRVNVMASVGVVVTVYGAIAIAATLLLRGLPRWQRTAAATCLAAAVVLGFSYARDVRDEQQAWARADDAADSVVAAVRAVVPAPRPGSTIYTFGHAGNERGGVSIFGASWDLKGAVQLAYDDPALSAYPMLEGTTMTCSDSGVGPVGDGWSTEAHGAAYQLAYFVDVASRTGERIDSRQQCEAAQGKYVPGPVIRPQ